MHTTAAMDVEMPFMFISILLLFENDISIQMKPLSSFSTHPMVVNQMLYISSEKPAFQNY